MSKLDMIPVYLRKTIFVKVFNIAEYTNLTREEKDMYDVEMKRKWDAYSIVTTAMAEGEKKGIAKGKAEGIAEGIAKGTVEGEIKSLEKVVINGSKNGLTLDQLQAITGWDKDRITEVLAKQ